MSMADWDRIAEDEFSGVVPDPEVVKAALRDLVTGLPAERSARQSSIID